MFLPPRELIVNMLGISALVVILERYTRSSQSEHTELLRAAEHPAKIALMILQGSRISPTGSFHCQATPKSYLWDSGELPFCKCGCMVVVNHHIIDSGLGEVTLVRLLFLLLSHIETSRRKGLGYRRDSAESLTHP